MPPVDELLDKCKKVRSIASDNALAQALGITRQTVSQWRAGKTYPDAVRCAEIAQITGLPLGKVLGIVGEARAISREEKAVWRKLAGLAASLLMALFLPVGKTEASQALAGLTSLNPGNSLYIMYLS